MCVDFFDMCQELFGCSSIDIVSERYGHDVARIHTQSSDASSRFKQRLDVGAFARGGSVSAQSPVPPMQADGATGLVGKAI